MIRVTVELVPKGDESKASRLSVMTIENDGTGTEAVGNYDVAIRSWPAPPGQGGGGVQARGRVEGFARQERAVLELVELAIAESEYCP